MFEYSVVQIYREVLENQLNIAAKAQWRVISILQGVRSLDYVTVTFERWIEPKQETEPDADDEAMVVKG